MEFPTRHLVSSYGIYSCLKHGTSWYQYHCVVTGTITVFEPNPTSRKRAIAKRITNIKAILWAWRCRITQNMVVKDLFGRIFDKLRWFGQSLSKITDWTGFPTRIWSNRPSINANHYALIPCFDVESWSKQYYEHDAVEQQKTSSQRPFVGPQWNRTIISASLCFTMVLLFTRDEANSSCNSCDCVYQLLQSITKSLKS
jgi:hypothetical protein